MMGPMPGALRVLLARRPHSTATRPSGPPSCSERRTQEALKVIPPFVCSYSTAETPPLQTPTSLSLLMTSSLRPTWPRASQPTQPLDVRPGHLLRTCALLTNAGQRRPVPPEACRRRRELSCRPERETPASCQVSIPEPVAISRLPRRAPNYVGGVRENLGPRADLGDRSRTAPHRTAVEPKRCRQADKSKTANKTKQYEGDSGTRRTTAVPQVSTTGCPGMGVTALSTGWLCFALPSVSSHYSSLSPLRHN